MSLTLEQFNQLSALQATALLKNCVHIPSWITTLVANRPFASVADLIQCATKQSQSWQWAEVKTALDQHPRIGQKKAAQTLNAKEQDFSVNEQGKLQLNDQISQALLDGNVAFETKFGHIFLIRAAGRSAEQILAELERRLQNSPEQEQREANEQLAQIAVLRLQQEIVA